MVRVVIDVAPEYVDASSRTGLTAEGYELLMEKLTAIGDVADGPEQEP